MSLRYFTSAGFGECSNVKKERAGMIGKSGIGKGSRRKWYGIGDIMGDQA